MYEGSKWKIVEDKEVRHRFLNKIDPVPSLEEDFKVMAIGNGPFVNIDNDKFSFTPRPVSEVIDELVKQAQ